MVEFVEEVGRLTHLSRFVADAWGSLTERSHPPCLNFARTGTAVSRRPRDTDRDADACQRSASRNGYESDPGATTPGSGCFLKNEFRGDLLMSPRDRRRRDLTD